MVNKYHQAFNIVKPLATIAGQKTIGAVKSAAKKAKAKALEFKEKQSNRKPRKPRRFDEGEK